MEDKKPLPVMVIEQASSGAYDDGKFGVVTQVPLVSSKHDPVATMKLVDAEHTNVAAALASTHCSAAVVGPLRFVQFGAVVVGAAVVSAVVVGAAALLKASLIMLVVRPVSV